MYLKLASGILITGVSLFGVSTLSASAQMKQTLPIEQVSDTISIIKIGDNKLHTFHGVSNSHIIETANELRLVDAQMLFKHADGLKAYIKKLGKPLVQVILSHNHPDHWFGAERFVDISQIATSANIKEDLKNGGGRYIKIMKDRMKDQIPDVVIVPTQMIALGKQSWDGLEVIVEEHAEQESHHSLLIKIPAHGVMIGQDLFYNNMFLVASERKRNKNWRDLLQKFSDHEVEKYKTLLVGHGKNGGPDILVQDIEYLDALETTLAKDLSQENTQNSMIAQFPNKGGKQMLGISMRNLYSGH